MHPAPCREEGLSNNFLGVVAADATLCVAEHLVSVNFEKGVDRLFRVASQVRLLVLPATLTCPAHLLAFHPEITALPPKRAVAVSERRRRAS